MDRVRVVETRDQQSSIESADELVARGRTGPQEHVQRERSIRVRRGQAVPGRLDTGLCGGLRVVHDIATDALLDQRHATLGDALVVERHRQPERIEAVVPDVDEIRPHAPAGLRKGPTLLDRERAEAEVAEHVQQVDDGVLLEDDRVVAGLDGDCVGRGSCLAGGLPAEGLGVDRGGIHRGGLGVARAAIGTHRNGDQLRGGPLAGSPDAQRVGHRDGLGAGRERAVCGHARGIGRGDDGPGALGAQLRSGLGGRPGIRGRQVRDGLPGSRQRLEFVVLLHVPGDPARRLCDRPESVRVEPPGRCHPDPAADHEAQVELGVRLGHVLVDLAVGEAGQGGVLGGHQCLGLGGSLGGGQAERLLGHGQPADGSATFRYHVGLTTCRRRSGRCGSARRSPRGRRARPGLARPCRSSACPASGSSSHRRRHRTIARTRR